MTKQQQRIGKQGQNLAAQELRALGVEMVEQIGTPVFLIPAYTKDVYRVVYGEKVSGDHRGILPGGISVLAETKTILDRNLRYSDLREHQPERLIEHAKHGGVSLLVWVNLTGVYIMQFPVENFTRGKSISVERALHISNHTRRSIEVMIDDYKKIAE